MQFLRHLRCTALAVLILVLVGGFEQNVTADEVASADAPKGSSLSLEELMLLADAVQKSQKNDGDDDASTSNFQHRLKQIIQTARVAAGSGQSTGSDVLDQTIRQVRARINASGGSISDTSIFDAAIKAVTSNGGGENKPAPDSESLVDTIVKQFTPEASTTPAPPADNSFIGGVLEQLANSDGSSGGTGKAILDAVVKQFVPTTTTTTTTTTTPKPDPISLISGLIRTISQKKEGDGQSGNVDGRSAPASGSGSTDPAKLLEGFKNILQQIQGKQSAGAATPTEPTPGAQAPAAQTGGPTGAQLLEGFLSQLKNLQNRGGTPAPSSSPDAQPAAQSGGANPNLAFLQDMLKQFQAKLSSGGETAKAAVEGVQTSTALPADLEGFEGLIQAGGDSNGDGTRSVTVPPPTQAPTSKPKGSNEAMQLIGGFVRQFSESAQQGGNQGAQGLLQGLGKLFGNRNQNMGR